MRSYHWMRSLTKILLDVSFLSAAITYLFQIRKSVVEELGEQRGLLMMVATEISVNDQALDRIIKEPHYLVSESQPVVLTTIWERYYPRFARLLGDQPFILPMEFYYQEILLFKESLQSGATGGHEVEKLRQKAEFCQQRGRSTRIDIYSYVRRLRETTSSKPQGWE